MHRKIMIVGDHLAEKDMRSGRPFTDGSGYVLDKMLSAAGIRRSECHVTCVFYRYPGAGGIERQMCGGKEGGILPAFSRGKYVRNEFQPELDRLTGEIERVNPNVILAMGNAALWALTGGIGIKKNRGTPMQGTTGHKVIPTWAPVSVIRQWTLRPIVIADLHKAKAQSEYPDIRRPKRIIHMDPTIEDIEAFYHEYIVPAPFLSVDIETKSKTITEIGFATSASRALVVPFYHRASPGRNYWSTFDEEREAWRWVRRILAEKPVIGQNYQYDLKYLWQTVGIPNPHFIGDTMILHHTLQPEMEKGLGFLASIYTQEPAWKWMRQDADKLKKEIE